MKKIKSCHKTLTALLISMLFGITLGGGASEDQKGAASVGSFKTRGISVIPEYYAKYKMPAKGDPVEMTYEFFEQNKSSLPIANPREELKPTYKNFDNIGGVVSFQQFYQGVPIQYAEIRARFTGTGELKSIEGDYHYDINLSTTPSIDSATAVKFALQDMGYYPKARVDGPHNPKIMAHKGKMHLVWTLKVFPGNRKNPFYHWVYYVDALDGSIVNKEADEGVVR